MKKQQTGLSLIELMIGIVLSSVIIAGIIQVFLANRQSFTITEGLARIQDNGRFAMDYIGNVVRTSGSFGCAELETSGFNSTVGDVDVTNLAAILGVVAGEAAVAGSEGAAAFGDPDEITFLQVLNNAAEVDTAAVTDEVLNLNAGGNFEPNDLLYVSNCSRGDYFSAGPDTADTAIDVAAAIALGFRFDEYQTLDDVHIVEEVRTVAFSVDTDTNELGVNINGAGAQPIIDGIENIQFSFGVDTSGNDGIPEFYTNELEDVDRSEVVSIKVSVLAVSNLAGTANVTGGQRQTITYNGVTEEMTDTQLRRVFENTFSIRGVAD